MLNTPLCDLLQIRYPIMQGALGPHDTSDLAMVVSRAGGLGVLSTVETDDIYRETRRQIQKLTKAGFSFGVNLPVKSVNSAGRLQALLDELGTDPAVRRTLKVVITSAGSPKWCAAALKSAGVNHFHVVASVIHAKKAVEAGCTGLIAEGNESGGHIAGEDGIPTLALVPAVIDVVNVPVVAAGGFIDGAGLVAALALGAVGIQMGTRFYMAAEAAFAHPDIQKALIGSDVSDTVIVPSVYGENRHWHNEYTDEVHKLLASGAPDAELAALKERGRDAKYRGDAMRASIPIGMVVGRIRTVLTVDDVIQQTMAGAEKAIRDLRAKLS